MPRRPRIHLANLPLHIVRRGHNRDACFFADEDYHAYRHWLGEALKSTGCLLHAYVQMTNHVHLLMTPPEPEAVSRLVISLGRRYVQYINKIYLSLPLSKTAAPCGSGGSLEKQLAPSGAPTHVVSR